MAEQGLDGGILEAAGSQSYVYILACGKAAGSMSPSEIQFTAPPPLFLYSHVRGDPVSKPWMAMMLHS